MHVTLLLAQYSSHASAALALEILDAANRFAAPAPAPFTLSVASLDGQPVANASGRTMAVDAALDDVARTDLVLIPGFLFSLREAPAGFRTVSRLAAPPARTGAVIASMCTASFMLADTGLLDGIEATTHWAFAGLLRRRYPEVRLDERRIICEDGRLISSAASAAMDLLLHLIRRFASRELAQQCSRYLLIDGTRSEQSVYVSWSMPRGHGDEAVLRVQDWMEAHFTAPLGIDELAARFGFGVRNFKRRFKDATGSTPLAYLQALRLEKAKQLLETTRLGFDEITSRGLRGQQLLPSPVRPACRHFPGSLPQALAGLMTAPRRSGVDFRRADGFHAVP